MKHSLIPIFIFASLCMQAQTLTTVKDIMNTASLKSSLPELITRFNNKLYFIAEDDTHGAELWESDGTDAGTKMALDYTPGLNGNYMYRMNVALNKLFIQYNNPNGSTNLLVSDGTLANTIKLSGVNDVSNTIAFNGFVYYLESENVFANIEVRMKKTDGTLAGTSTVATLFTNYTSLPNLYDCELVIFNNRIYFTLSNDGNGDRELMFYDPAGNFYGYGDLGTDYVFNMVNLHVFKNKLYCNSNAKNSFTGDELYEVNTNYTSTLKADINFSTFNSSPRNFFEFNNHLFFSALSGPDGRQLYWCDTTSGSVTMWPKFTTGNYSAWPDNNTAFKGDMYFSAITDTCLGLFKYNTSTNLIEWIQNISNDINRQEGWMKSFFVYNGLLYFMGAKTGIFDGGFSYTPDMQLWQSDGTTAGTKLVALAPTPIQYAGLQTRDVVLHNGSAFFSGNYNGKGIELQKLTTFPLTISDKLSTEKLVVYPNPFADNFVIENIDALASSIVISNTMGSIIAQQQILVGKNNVDMQAAKSGMYLLQILNSENKIIGVYKIVKQ
jgi:ELWxxDGT repeat protein